MRRTAPEATVEVEVLARVPALDFDANGTVAALLGDLTGRAEGAPVAYGTDGALLAAAGMPTVIVGPGEPSQMHQADESVTTEQLRVCQQFLADVGAWAR